MIGIYFLFNDKKLVYIGQSIDTDKRVYSHKVANKMTFDSHRVIPCSKDKLRHYEARLIKFFQPKLNIQGRYETICVRVPLWAVDEVDQMVKEYKESLFK